jgi:C-terminal processing protease CtpA/Prc
LGALGIELAMQDGLLKVGSPIQGMPAAKAGILAGDIMTHVDDATTQGLSLVQAIDKLRGPVDTKVRLRIVRKGQDRPIEMSLVRAQIRLPGADLQVVNKAGQLLVEASGDLPLLDFNKGAATTVVPMSSNEFFVDGGDHTRLAFLRDGTGPKMRLVLNPGPWQITGRQIN